MLTSAELQMLQSLQQKQLLGERQNQFIPPQVPQIPIPQQPSFDANALNNLIDQKVSERLQALQVQAQQPQIPVQAAPPVMKTTQEQVPMLSLKSQEKAMMDRLRPLFMGALTLEQKGRLAELAFAVHAQANSTEHAYRVGFDALCGFLETPTGKEWIQVGTNAFFQALEQTAPVPSNINVSVK
jgi:hypothetical protein